MLSLVRAPLSDSIVSPPELKAPTSVGSLDHNSEKMGLDHSRQKGFVESRNASIYLRSS